MDFLAYNKFWWVYEGIIRGNSLVHYAKPSETTKSGTIPFQGGSLQVERIGESVGALLNANLGDRTSLWFILLGGECGVGKTRTAAEICSRHMDKFSIYIFWTITESFTMDDFSSQLIARYCNSSNSCTILI